MAAYRGPRRGAPGRRGTSQPPPQRTAAPLEPTGAGHGRPGTGRGNTGRGADLPRRTAYDVLAAVETRQAYANLLLPRLLAERGITGRDAALATELSLRHAARSRHLRRGARRVQRPAPGQAGPAGAAGPQARRAPAPGDPGRRPRRRGDLGGPGQGRGRPARLRLRQRRAAPGRHPRPRRLAAARRPGPGGRRRGLPGGPLQLPPLDRRRLPRRPRPRRGHRASRCPGRRQRPPPRHDGRLPRRPAPRGDHARGRRARLGGPPTASPSQAETPHPLWPTA